MGFPTETEQDFLDTLSLVKKVKYEQLFMFIYSKRGGTVAEKLDGQVDIATKKERLRRLIAAQEEIGTSVAEKYVGKTLTVLVNDVHPKKKGYMLGTTYFNKNVNFVGDRSLIGKKVKVEIQSSKLTVLTGKIVEEL